MARSEATPKVRVTKENLVALPALAPYFALGILSFVAVPLLSFYAADALAAGLYRHLTVLAVLHAAVLGWGSSVALGALQQMAAVVGATRLYSTPLAALAFFPFAAGVIGLVSGFFFFSPAAFAIAAFGVPVGIALVVTNLVCTMGTAQPTVRWMLIEPFVKGSLFYVFIAFVAGGTLAFNLPRGILGALWNGVFPLHIGTAVVGWFVMLVIGVSYHLLTFFGLVDKRHTFRFVKQVRRLLHAGICLSIVAAAGPALLRSRASVPSAAADTFSRGLMIIAVLALVTAFGLFLWDTRRLFARSKRQKVNVALTYVRIAHVYLGLGAFLLALALAANVFSLQSAYLFAFGSLTYVVLGVIAIGGWLSNTILGYLHRILAFFVWHNKYWGRGREPGVPAFRDMVNEQLAWLGLVVYNGGVFAVILSLCAGLSIRWALLMWTVGALCIAGNLVRTLLR